MIHHHQPAAPARPRRGALLLLVLSVLTLFMMIGTLMLVLAMRARSTARAFADAVAGPGIQAGEARGMLHEALMALIRGKAPNAEGDPLESLLADRYGEEPLKGELTAQLAGTGPIRQARITLENPPPKPQDLHGRILTIIPKPTDPAPIASFRILSFDGTTAELANLRTVDVRLFPSEFPCDVMVNGREFAGGAAAANESWDAYDGENKCLTKTTVGAADGAVAIDRPAFGDPGETLEVDNDGDGVLDGIFLDDVLPASASGAVARISYLVLDLGGRLNLNAHGSLSPNPRPGPATVDGKPIFPSNSTAWNDLLAGATSPAQQRPPAKNGRRFPPALGGTVQGRFGAATPNADPPPDSYALRLDFDGPRFASRQSQIGNVFTIGELEPVLRPFDVDTRTLPPRLSAILGDAAEAIRMLVTTDSWDTCGLTGSLANTVAAAANFPDLPADVKEGLRFDLDHPDLSLEQRDGDTADAVKKRKERLFEGLRAASVVAGAPDDSTTSQWAANVIDFADADTDSDRYGADGPGQVQGVEPSTVQKNGQPAFSGWDRGRIESVGELLGVPVGSKAQLDAALKDAPPPPPETTAMLRSLAANHPEILDLVDVGSPFRTTVFLEVGGRRFCRWREPGRVNINTCDDKIWDAVAGREIANPFQTSGAAPGEQPAPAKSLSDALMRIPEIFSQPSKDARSLDRGLANRLASIATTRSDVFAVWITLESKDSASDPSPEYHRLFAIVDRSIPVGHAPGRNLNAGDTIRVLRHLE